MKKSLLFILFFQTCFVFAQSKKEQIKLLTARVDSLIYVIKTEEQSSTSTISNLNQDIFELNERKKKLLDENVKNDSNLKKCLEFNEILLQNIQRKSDSIKQLIQSNEMTNERIYQHNLQNINAIIKTNDTINKPKIRLGDKVKDIDGNTYSSVIIGHQEWFAENLKTTKFNNGTLISNINNNNKWLEGSYINRPAWCYYDEDISNNNTYGKLYNFYTISQIDNKNRNACPKGWHVPTDEEWIILTDYLGGENCAGDKLKEEFTKLDNNYNSINCLFGGAKYSEGFGGLSQSGLWWSSTENSPYDSWSREINDQNNHFRRRYVDKDFGLSIRCLKDSKKPFASVKELDCKFIQKKSEMISKDSSLVLVASYKDGNGGIFNSQIINSTNVEGLKLKIDYGTLIVGEGSLVYEFSGTPLSKGKASFAISIGGKSCFVNLIVSDIIEFPKIGIDSNVNDIDGNNYKTSFIGSQHWMIENLRTTKYNNGVQIANISNKIEWSSIKKGAWCYFDNNIKNDKYGKLYNLEVVRSNKICPQGWHVPSDYEIDTLINYLKSKEISHNSQNEIINFSSFIGNHIGYRTASGFFEKTQHESSRDSYGIWWSANESFFGTYDDNKIFTRKNNIDYFQKIGASIRCISDYKITF